MGEKEIRRRLEQILDCDNAPENLIQLKKEFGGDKVINYIYLVKERMITIGEAVESLSNRDDFVILANP